MLIRRATPEDLSGIGELTAAAYADVTLGPDDPYLDKLRDAASRDREAELWVAADGDLLLGSVTVCAPGSAWREIAGADEGEFRMLAVSPAARGRGVGEALVRHAVAALRGHGCTGVVLSTLPQMSAAHRIYARLGFVRAPERDWTPVPGTDLLAYVLDLRESGAGGLRPAGP